MKEYKIIIEKVEHKEGEKYPNKTEIFTQILPDLDTIDTRLLKIIKAVNDISN